jgi:hypothetical protein
MARGSETGTLGAPVWGSLMGALVALSMGCDTNNASASTSLWGASGRIHIAGRVEFGYSKSPYLGRGGRSGIALPLPVSDTDAERALVSGLICPSTSNGEWGTTTPAVM